MSNFLLLIAAMCGHDEIVEELLNRKAIIEAKDVDEWTPLIWGMFVKLFIKFK
jgi:ankyrin repeat protein